ncbi:MAG TPA: cupin domain-containing protein [Polyangiaceae bacterium]|nr:cupin domain-containing protein [Polyangiaceae bacterium]
MTAMIKNIDNAEHYRWGQVCDGWRLLDGPDLSVIQERIPPGEGEVTHYHSHARQCFFVLAGELQIQIDEQLFRLTTGDSLEVAPGKRHRVRNAGHVDAAFLVVSAPTTRGDRVNVEP